MNRAKSDRDWGDDDDLVSMPTKKTCFAIRRKDINLVFKPNQDSFVIVSNFVCFTRWDDQTSIKNDEHETLIKQTNKQQRLKSNNFKTEAKQKHLPNKNWKLKLTNSKHIKIWSSRWKTLQLLQQPWYRYRRLSSLLLLQVILPPPSKQAAKVSQGDEVQRERTFGCRRRLLGKREMGSIIQFCGFPALSLSLSSSL